MRPSSPHSVARIWLLAFFLLAAASAFADSINIGFLAIPPIYTRTPHYCPCESAPSTRTIAFIGSSRFANGHPSLTMPLLLPPPLVQTYLQPGQSFAFVINSQAMPVPEPSSLLLLGTGLVATAALARLKMRR